jgi:hypothetical protein
MESKCLALMDRGRPTIVFFVRTGVIFLKEYEVEK